MAKTKFGFQPLLTTVVTAIVGIVVGALLIFGSPVIPGTPQIAQQVVGWVVWGAVGISWVANGGKWMK